MFTGPLFQTKLHLLCTVLLRAFEILAWNIWLNYEGRRPEFSQNGGYAVWFAEWLRAIDLPLHRRFCNVSMLVGLTSRCICFLHIFIHHFTSRVLCYIFLSPLNDQKYHLKPSWNPTMTSILEWPRLFNQSQDRFEIGSNFHVLATANHMPCSMLNLRIHLFYSIQ